MNSLKGKFRFLLFSALLIFLFIEIWMGFPIQLEKGSEERLLSAQTVVTAGPEKKMENVHLVESRVG